MDLHKILQGKSEDFFQSFSLLITTKFTLYFKGSHLIRSLLISLVYHFVFIVRDTEIKGKPRPLSWPREQFQTERNCVKNQRSNKNINKKVSIEFGQSHCICTVVPCTRALSQGTSEAKSPGCRAASAGERETFYTAHKGTICFPSCCLSVHPAGLPFLNHKKHHMGCWPWI